MRAFRSGTDRRATQKREAASNLKIVIKEGERKETRAMIVNYDDRCRILVGQQPGLP